MKIYVAAPLAAAELVQHVQARLLAAGHTLTCDWTQDMSLVEGFASQPERSAAMATLMVDAVLAADAVVVLATEHERRGMFVELGLALARARAGALRHIAIISEIQHESVFYLHPLVRRHETLDEWLAEVDSGA